ncbi:MAG: hypothetical protein AAF871_12095 [Pseudomonadota bacterium]
MLVGRIISVATAVTLLGSAASADITTYSPEVHLGFLYVTDWQNPYSGNDEGFNERLSFSIYQDIELAPNTSAFVQLFAADRASQTVNTSIGVEQDLGGAGLAGLSVFAAYGGLDSQAIFYDGEVRTALAAANRMQVSLFEDLDENDYARVWPYERTDQIFIGADYDVGPLTFGAAVSDNYILGDPADQFFSATIHYVSEFGFHAGVLVSGWERYDGGVNTQRRDATTGTVGYRNDTFAVMVDIGQYRRKVVSSATELVSDVYAVATEYKWGDVTAAAAYGNSTEGGGMESLVGSLSYKASDLLDIYVGGFDAGRNNGRGEQGLLAGLTLNL